MKNLTLLTLLPALVVAACTDGTTGTMSLSLTARGGGAAVTTSGDSTMIRLGNDTVIVRSVDLVLREIELKRADVAACDAVEGNGDCQEFETGPVLLSLPLGSAAIAQLVSVVAPAGTYDKFEFEIHKPNAGDDAAFIVAHPDFAGVSIRVTGTYSQAGARSDFTFTSDVDQGEEAGLVPPVTVQEGGAVNITLRVDISGWFLNGSKTALIDPASANKGQPNESLVANNIQNSFDAFEDDDHDGLED